MKILFDKNQHKIQKILILTNNSGGLYAFRRELIIELAKTKEIIASTPFDGRIDELKTLGCRLIQTEFDRRGINPVKDLALILTYRRIIKEENPDYVITYTIKPNLYGGIASRITKHKYAANITGLGTAFENNGFLKQLVTLMYHFSLKKAKVVFFENSANRDLFLKEKMIKPGQACLLNGAGVNLDWFTVQPYPNNDVFRFLFIGRIMKEKGVDELFSAMEQLNRDGITCHLDMLGDFEEDYEQIIKKYEEEGWLTYHGSQPDVRPYIAQSDCFVLPSWHEGMANTNLECAASGRPVITSNIPGCKEAVIDGKSGFLCIPKDADNLYQIMKKAMMLSVTERKEMGKAGRRHMENCFDKKTVVQNTVDYIIQE